MNVYRIPKKDFQDLYIFEGGLYSCSLKDMSFSIVVNCIEYPDLPENFHTPDYMEFIKVNFNKCAYLKLITSYDIGKSSYEDSIEVGKITCEDELLEYSGSLYSIATKFDIPTSFIIKVICDNIELEII